MNSGTPLRQRIVLFIEEVILSPIEEYVEALTAAYPETARVLFRYVQTPIRKVIQTVYTTWDIIYLKTLLYFI